MNNTTAVSIASNALQLIGDAPLTSFTDEGAGATVAKAFYETSYVSLLTSHTWTFAKAKKTLNRLIEPPLNEYNYAFQIPTDCLKIITTDASDYMIYGDKIYTNATSMDLEYITRVDESFLPPLYREALEFYLASKWAIPVTENSTNAGVYAQLFADTLKRAKYNDGFGNIGRAIADVGMAPLRIRRR